MMWSDLMRIQFYYDQLPYPSLYLFSTVDCITRAIAEGECMLSFNASWDVSYIYSMKQG